MMHQTPLHAWRPATHPKDCMGGRQPVHEPELSDPVMLPCSFKHFSPVFHPLPASFGEAKPDPKGLRSHQSPRGPQVWAILQIVLQVPLARSLALRAAGELGETSSSSPWSLSDASRVGPPKSSQHLRRDLAKSLESSQAQSRPKCETMRAPSGSFTQLTFPGLGDDLRSDGSLNKQQLLAHAIPTRIAKYCGWASKIRITRW